jgi:hypothetical protein
MPQTLEIHRPILLCELFDRALLIRLFELLQPFGYKAYILGSEGLTPLAIYAEGQIPSLNCYFLPPQREDRFRSFVQA